MVMLPTTVPAAAADASCELQSYIRSSGDDYERLLLQSAASLRCESERASVERRERERGQKIVPKVPPQPVGHVA